MKKHIETLIEKFGLRPVVFTVVTLFAVVIAPTLAMSWGPDRPTFTRENPANYVTFNSITNSTPYGDERNFMRIKESTASNTTYGDDVNVTPGKEYEILVMYHNNAKSSLNASGVGVAHGAYARAEVPAVVPKGGANTMAAAYVGATNAQPTSVYDHINFKNTTAGDIAMRYVPGSAVIHNNGATNGTVLADTILSGTGVKLGYNSLDGVLPGCNEFAGYITFRVKADQPNFTFKKDVRIDGTKTWNDSITANKGAVVEYQLSYKNTGTMKQNDVVLKDVLPKGVTYVPGTSELINSANPNGKKLDDGIKGGGMNIGNYSPGANAFLYFKAKIDGNACDVLVNTAAAETDNGNVRDTATVNVGGDCKNTIKVCDLTTKQIVNIKEDQFDSKKHSKNVADCGAASELPTTGPAEIIASLIAVAAITIGVVYYIKSRKDLQEALKKAQGFDIK